MYVYAEEGLLGILTLWVFSGRKLDSVGPFGRLLFEIVLN